MTKGSLVIMLADDQKTWATGVILKGPYGTVIKDTHSHVSRETSVVDVLFSTQVVKKVPTSKLKVLK